MVRNGDGVLDFDEFDAMGRKNPSLLYPLLRAQELLREASFGRAAWAEYTTTTSMELVRKMVTFKSSSSSNDHRDGSTRD